MRPETIRPKGARAAEVVASGITLPRWSSRLARFCGAVLADAGAAEWEVAVLLCDDATIASLNSRYRGKEGPTDVLSFPRSARPRSPRFSFPRRVEGDIAVSLDTLRRNARELRVGVEEELKRLLVHGLLHCAGLDHGRGRGGAMIARQEAIVRAFTGTRIIGARRN